MSIWLNLNIRWKGQFSGKTKIISNQANSIQFNVLTDEKRLFLGEQKSTDKIDSMECHCHRTVKMHVQFT